MAQAAFDHWFNMLADPDYANRCHRKRQFRQRRSPAGKFQVDEDVWARHPNDGVMYIASISAVDMHNDTYIVIFVDNGQIFNLPANHLRHVSQQDIKCNRYVDYGQSWSEQTHLGAINTYDRYGELIQVQFMGSSKDIYNDFDTVECNKCNDDAVEDNAVLPNITEENDLRTIGFLKLLPVLLKEMDNSQLLKTWPDLNIHLIEKIRKQSSSIELNTSMDYSIFGLEEQPLFLHHIQENKNYILSCQDDNITQIHTSSQELLHQQLPVKNVRDEDYKLLVSIPHSQDFLTVKEVGIQTESSISSSITDANIKHVSTVMNNSTQLVEYVSPVATSEKKKTSTQPSKDYWHILEDILLISTSVTNRQYKFWANFRSHKYITKLLSSVMVITMVIYQLLMGSMVNKKDLNSVAVIIRYLVSTTIISRDTLSAFSTTVPSFSLVLAGPSQSTFELWFYPFAVP